MTIEPGLETVSFPEPVEPAGDGKAADVKAPASNLAQLLDSFTSAFTKPEAETVGSFAATVEALHGELTLLARHFGAEALAADGASGQIDFDDIFPDAPVAAEEPIEPGIAQSEELEHLCRELSRS